MVLMQIRKSAPSWNKLEKGVHLGGSAVGLGEQVPSHLQPWPCSSGHPELSAPTGPPERSTSVSRTAFYISGETEVYTSKPWESGMPLGSP